MLDLIITFTQLKHKKINIALKKVINFSIYEVCSVSCTKNMKVGDYNMKIYKYLCGLANSREAVEFSITRGGQYITTCVVIVDLLISGIKAFP